MGTNYCNIACVFVGILVFLSCNSISSEKRQKNESSNNKLLGFKLSYLAELGDEKYDQLQKKVKKNSVETKYINDIIYVFYFEELNACGQYNGNIEINADTIRLKVNLTSYEVCTSTSISKVTFLIDNPDEKNKIILKYSKN